MIDHLWHNCQAANLCKQADIGTSSIVQPAPAIEENEDCLWLAGAAPALALFPGSCVWAEKKEPGTHFLRMLSSPRISGNLESSVKSASLH